MRSLNSFVFVFFSLLGVCLVGLILLYFFQQHREEKLLKKASIGTYIFDQSHSEVRFSRSDSIFYDGIIMRLDPNDSFYISKRIPALRDTLGVWEIDASPLVSNIMLYTNDKPDQQIGACCGPDSVISISIPLYDEGGEFEKFGWLAFRKIQ